MNAAAAVLLRYSVGGAAKEEEKRLTSHRPKLYFRLHACAGMLAACSYSRIPGPFVAKSPFGVLSTP